MPRILTPLLSILFLITTPVLADSSRLSEQQEVEKHALVADIVAFAEKANPHVESAPPLESYMADARFANGVPISVEQREEITRQFRLRLLPQLDELFRKASTDVLMEQLTLDEIRFIHASQVGTVTSEDLAQHGSAVAERMTQLGQQIKTSFEAYVAPANEAFSEDVTLYLKTGSFPPPHAAADLPD